MVHYYRLIHSIGLTLRGILCISGQLGGDFSKLYWLFTVPRFFLKLFNLPGLDGGAVPDLVLQGAQSLMMPQFPRAPAESRLSVLSPSVPSTSSSRLAFSKLQRAIS